MPDVDPLVSFCTMDALPEQPLTRENCAEVVKVPADACAIPREKEALKVISTSELAVNVSVLIEARASSVIGGRPIMFWFVVMIFWNALTLPGITCKLHWM